MIEMLIVMAIMTILAASLVILVPGLRTRAMRAQAGADIHLMSMAIAQYREDKGGYPDRPYAPANPDAPGAYDYIDRCLFEWLTNPSSGGSGNGWGGAKDTWEFLRGDSKTLKQILDPWGVPYYYIPANSYLLGVRVNDPTDSTLLKDTTTNKALPNCYGSTPAADDKPEDWGTIYPSEMLKFFYNPTTFQIHSKGPDQRTDYYSDKVQSAEQQAIVDPLDRGCDPDDVNNFGGGNAN
jgi:type II secretory pathway pseudopilin PulG